MTVNSQQYKQLYATNGVATVFPFNFKTTDVDWIKCYLAEVEGGAPVEVTNFTVTLNVDQETSSGGTVTFTVPVPVGSLAIVREVPATQLLDYTSYGPFPAESHEMAIDKLTYLSQLLEGSVGDFIKYGHTTDAVAVSATLEKFQSTPIDQTGFYLRWKEDGIIEAHDLGTDLIDAEAAAAAAAQSAAESAASAGASQVSAGASQVSADAAVASLYEFDGIYYRALPADPALDPNGDPMNVGDMYWNSTESEMRVFSGLTWQPTTSAVSTIKNEVLFNPTVGQTEFSLAYNVGYLEVYYNGVRLVPSVNFTASNGTSFVLAEGANSTEDEIVAVAFGAFEVGDPETVRTALDVYSKEETDDLRVLDLTEVADAIDASDTVALRAYIAGI